MKTNPANHARAHSSPVQSKLLQTAGLQKCKIYLLICCCALVASCSPQDERPGLWIQGEEVASVIDDWQFTDEIQEIEIETHTRYLFPHSTTIWAVQYDDELYIGSYGEEKKFWESNIERDPRAKIRIDNRKYDVALSRVTDEILTQDIDAAYNLKYDMQEVFGDDVPEWWFYRVVQQL